MSDLIYTSSVFDCNFSSNQGFVSFPFCYKGKLMTNSTDFPICNLTLKSSGTMRFRWNEVNSNRDDFIKNNFSSKIPIPIELIHSKIVYAIDLDNEDNLILLDSYGNTEAVKEVKIGDGLLSCNPKIVPLVTVADCLPIYLFDPVTKVFGLVHSGWKGTGIATNAISLASKIYNSKVSDFCVVIGPHIHKCCYKVDLERANYFSSTYGNNCVSVDTKNQISLSLVQSNINLLLKIGVSKDNILHCSDCTSCDSRFGSFRRETTSLTQSISLEEPQLNFTPMAAFLTFPS
ncbi:MAG: polyphenol oxidase family protein [Spirochaetaceae bacterium]|nr:polyphenol oxidase family protein [Spirochaetaceae bacterium]